MMINGEDGISVLFHIILLGDGGGTPFLVFRTEGHVLRILGEILLDARA